MLTDYRVMLVVSVMVVSIVSTVVAVLVVSRRKRTGPGPGGSGGGAVGEIEYTCRYYPGSRNSAPRFRIEIPCRTSGSFKTAKESAFDRFFRNLGLCAEIRTGDREFDERFYITTDTVEFTGTLLADPAVREAVRRIHDSGFTEVGHDGKKMWALKSPYRDKEPIPRETIEEIAALLGRVGKNPPQPASPSRFAGQSSWKTRRAAAFALPAFAEMTGIALVVIGIVQYLPLDTWAAVRFSLGYTLPLLALFLVASVFLLKGRSSSHRELLIVWALAITGIPVAGAGSAILLNGALDRQNPSPHTVQVLGKRISRSDNSTTYHVTLRSWREGRGTESITVGSKQYSRIVPRRSRMTVTTMPGRFGFEWVKGYVVER